MANIPTGGWLKTMGGRWWQLFENPKTYLSLLVIAMALLPALDTTTRYFYHKETYNNNKEQIKEAVELVNGLVISQQINIEGHFTRLAICLDSLGRDNTGEIRVSIIKNGQHIFSKSMQMSSLAAGRHIVDLNPGPITGPLELRLQGVGGKPGSAAGIIFSKGLYFGPLAYDGSAAPPRNLQLIVDTRTISPISLIRIGLFIALLLLVKWAIAAMFSPKEDGTKLFGLSFFIILISLCLRLPLLTFLGEPYHEAGSNFYKLIYEYPVSESIFFREFTYWGLFQRLIATIIVKIFGLDKWAFTAMYMTMSVLLAATFSMFCLNSYKGYMAKEFRFVCSIFLGCNLMAMNYNLTSFFNAPYFGLVYLFFIAMLDLDKISRPVYILILVSSVACISKGHYILMIPFAFFTVLYCLIKRRNKRLGTFAAAILLSSVIQFIYMIKITPGHYYASTSSAGMLLTSIQNNLYFYSIGVIKTYLTPTMFNLDKQSGYMWHFMAYCIIGAIFLFAVRQIKNGCDPQKAWIILLGVALSFASMLMAVMANIKAPGFNFVAWMDIKDFQIIHRQLVFVTISLTMVLIVIFSVISKWPDGQWVLCILFAIVMIPRAQTIDGSANSNGLDRPDWHLYYNLMQRDSYAIPLRGTRFIIKNAELLYVGYSKTVDDNKWNDTVGAKPIKLIQDADNAGNQADLSGIVDFTDKNIIALYARKIGSAQASHITAIFLDANDNILRKVPSINDRGRLHIAFIPEVPIRNVSYINFIDQSGFPVDLLYDYYLGVETR